jgi:hypothetical protein
MAAPKSTTGNGAESSPAELAAKQARSGHFVETNISDEVLSVARGKQAGGQNEPRRPGRFKDILQVGPAFFEPLTKEELADLTGG